MAKSKQKIMELNDKQQKRIEALAMHTDSPELSTLSNLLDIKDTIDEIKTTMVEDNAKMKECMDGMMTNMKEMPDHTAHIEEMMAMMKEPMEITAEIEIV